MDAKKRIVPVYCLECGAESEANEERLRRFGTCDAETDEGELCRGALMERKPDLQAAQGDMR